MTMPDPECYDLHMRRLFLISTLFFLAARVFASSSQAYQDYLYQFDQYRQKSTDFSVAKNEYEKFGTLTSQTTAFQKTVDVLSQRDNLLRAYLLLLNEKLNESPGAASTDRNLYLSLVRNEVTFLESHRKLVDAIGSLDDAKTASGNLESHYNALSASIRQTIAGIALDGLLRLASQFDQSLSDSKVLIVTNHGLFTPEKQSTLDRWVLQITNTRSLAQQKIDDAKGKSLLLSSLNPDQQNDLFSDIKKNLAQGKQYLLDGSSNLRELVEAMRYQDEYGR